MKKSKNIEGPVIFSENQRFRQVWLWVILAIPVVVFWYAFVHQIILGNQFGNRPMPDSMTILFVLIFGLVLPISFYVTELRTRVTNEGVYVKFIPIHQSWIHFSPIDINKYEKVHYRPILDYGGWGIRFGIHGKAYSVSGTMGIKLTLSGGERLLVGTQKADEFERALQKLRKGDSDTMHGGER